MAKARYRILGSAMQQPAEVEVYGDALRVHFWHPHGGEFDEEIPIAEVGEVECTVQKGPARIGMVGIAAGAAALFFTERWSMPFVLGGLFTLIGLSFLFLRPITLRLELGERAGRLVVDCHRTPSGTVRKAAAHIDRRRRSS